MLHWQFRFVMRPDYLYFLDSSNDHNAAPTLVILMRITHNQDMSCTFVVLEAQLLAIPVARGIDRPRCLKEFKILKKKIKNDFFCLNNKEFLFETMLSWLGRGVGCFCK